MLGAIIGDVAGSIYEVLEVNYQRKHKTHRPYEDRIKILDKNLNLFTNDCSMTDDSVLTCAIADAYLNNKEYGKVLKEYGLNELNKGLDAYGRNRFGRGFKEWLQGSNFTNSYGNGCAMRISALPTLIEDVDELKKEVYKSVIPTHNHEESILCSEALAMTIFLAKQGYDKKYIKEYIENNYFSLNYDIEDLRKNYSFKSRAIDSVPQAIYVFLQSNNFISTLKNAISIGGDSDTIASMACAISEHYFGIPEDIKKVVMNYIPDDYKEIINKVYSGEEYEKSNSKIKRKK